MNIVSVHDCLMTDIKFRHRQFAQNRSLKQPLDSRMQFSMKNANLEFFIDYLGLHLEQKVLLGFIEKSDVDFSKLLLKILNSNHSDSTIKTVFEENLAFDGYLSRQICR